MLRTITKNTNLYIKFLYSQIETIHQNSVDVGASVFSFIYSYICRFAGVFVTPVTKLKAVVTWNLVHTLLFSIYKNVFFPISEGRYLRNTALSRWFSAYLIDFFVFILFSIPSLLHYTSIKVQGVDWCENWPFQEV